MKLHFPTLALLGVAYLASTASADSIKLKDGSVLTGKILSESADSVQIEYNISKGVKDIRIVPRSTIKPGGIEKETPDQTAFAVITKLRITPDLLDTAGYDAIIADKPAKFMRTFKESPLRDDVQSIIDRLLAEKARVEAGDIKIAGKWIDAAHAAKDPYNHAAHVLLARFKLDLAKRDFATALAKFDRLGKDYTYSAAFVESLPLAESAITNHASRLNRMQATHKTLLKQRERNLMSSDPDDRQRTKLAFAELMKVFQQRRQDAADAGDTWLPVNEWDLKSITDAISVAESESENIRKFNTTKIKAAANLLANAFQSYSAGKLSQAAAQLSLATSAGVRGDVVQQLSDDISNARKAADAAALAAAAAAATAIPTPAATPTPPDSPEDKPAMENPDAAEDKPAMKSPDAAKTATATENATTDVAHSAEEEKDGISLQKMIMLIVGLLLVITVLAKVFIKPSDKG